MATTGTTGGTHNTVGVEVFLKPILTLRFIEKVYNREVHANEYNISINTMHFFST